jgi:hypothetical protein
MQWKQHKVHNLAWKSKWHENIDVFIKSDYIMHLPANPTITSYNDSAVKNCNAASSLAHFWKQKYFLLIIKNDLAYYNAGVVFKSRRIGSRSQSYDRELQRQRCKKICTTLRVA